jgi:hypothetical protein
MIYDIIIDDGSTDDIDGTATSVFVSLTYRRWVPGRDPWAFKGAALGGVSDSDWEIIKATGLINMFANFSGQTEAGLLSLYSFGNLSHDPTIGDTGSGLYIGPPGSFGQTDSNSGAIRWKLLNVR